MRISTNIDYYRKPLFYKLFVWFYLQEKDYKKHQYYLWLLDGGTKEYDEIEDEDEVTLKHENIFLIKSFKYILLLVTSSGVGIIVLALWHTKLAPAGIGRRSILIYRTRADVSFGNFY